jgi:serine/threonine-protein kinase
VQRQATAAAGKALWTRERIRNAAAVSVAAPLVLLATLHFVVGEHPRAAPAGPTARPEPSAVAAAPLPAATAAGDSADAGGAPDAAPVATEALGADAGPEPEAPDGGSAGARPTGVDAGGTDAAGWQQMLRGTAVSSDWKRGAEAILVLSQQAPDALVERGSLEASATIAARIQAQDPPLADQVFDALGGTAPGLDVLYRLVSVRGGSVAAERATKLLAQPEVRARATPALRAALELREAPCADKEARAEQAGADGDHRALAILLQLKSPTCTPATDGCCARDSALVDAAVRAITQRERAPRP